MATGSNYWTVPGLKASSSLASYQFYPIKPSTTAGECKLASASSDKVIGILQNAPAAGEAAEVAYMGICKAIAGVADLAAGERVACNTSGIIDTTTGGQFVVGVALEASAAVGDLVAMIVAPGTMGD